MPTPDTPHSNDSEVADVSAAQCRLIQLLAEAVAERLVQRNREPNSTAKQQETDR